MRYSRSSVKIVLVVLLMVVAGCGGMLGDDTDREPYAVESDDDESEELIPGLTNEGVTSSSTLWLAHVDGVSDTAYERSDRTTIRDENGTLSSARETQTTVADGGSPVLTVFESTDEWPQSAIWYGENTTVSRHVDENGSVNLNIHSDLSPPDPTLAVDPLSLYDAVDTVTVNGSDEMTRYHLTGTGDVSGYENATFEVVLDENGIVKEFVFEGETTHDGEPMTREFYTNFASVDESIHLEEPDWVKEAQEESPDSNE